MGEACATPAVDTTRWRRHDAENFTVLLPPDLRFVRMVEIDSREDYWRGRRGRTLLTDYFWSFCATGELERVAPRPERSRCETSIDGVPVIVTLELDARWAELSHGRKPPQYTLKAIWPRVNGRARLYFTARTPRAADQDELLAMVRSVRFKS